VPPGSAYAENSKATLIFIKSIAMSKNDTSHRVKLITNPGAGNMANTSKNLEDVTRYLTERGFEVEIALAKPTEEATPIARKAVKKGYPIIIAMGGDHTIISVVQGMADSDAQLGIIPSGTANDIAASLGIPEDMQAASDIIASQQTRMLDLAQISTKDKKKFIFFMVTAVGLTATIFPEIKDVPHGDFSNIKEAFLTFLEFQPTPKVFLTLDDESKIAVETMLVTITNTPLIGVKNLVAPEASMEDGLLDIAVYPDFSKSEMLAYFAKTAKQGYTEDGKIQRYRAKKIKIKTDPKLDIAAEGAILGKGSAKIKVLPHALRVIAPPVGTGAEKPAPGNLEELPTPVSLPVNANNH
jgi:diacylglycerol kinase (ATP)